MQSSLKAVIAVTAVAAFAAASARAQDLPGVQTPSHNIYCMASPAMEGQPNPVMRCDIQQMSTRMPPPPPNCPLSWGDAFFLEPTGPGQLMCHGDTVANPSYPILDYGKTWSIYGFTCQSQTTGMTCTNSQGHGFAISREAQNLF